MFVSTSFCVNQIAVKLVRERKTTYLDGNQYMLVENDLLDAWIKEELLCQTPPGCQILVFVQQELL